MKKFSKDKLLVEGKTKKIWSVKENPNLIIIENKKDITAFDNPEFTKRFEMKARYATATTCRVFELLQRKGIPVAYVEQISDTEFLAPVCEMIPLEVVARRYAVGSFLKRHPEFARRGDEKPFRFDDLKIEFFLKTTQGKLINHAEKVVVEGLDAKKGEEDPLIENPNSLKWKLLHPKKQPSDPASDLKREIAAVEVVNNLSEISFMKDTLRKTFLSLEKAWWETCRYRLIDMKIEFGRTKKGEVLIADVIDNDSWRLRDENWQELSKEAFRQGEELSEVEQKYGLVAELVEKWKK
ncbi:MAG: hypothetical protein GXO74_13925 [Calditrichaeota bacterium]|nr:hypothetical protein [Calditrichota bacterium]